MSAVFTVEELYALDWCMTTLFRMLADANPALPAEVFDEEVHDKILFLIASATAKVPTRNQSLLISLTGDAVIIFNQMIQPTILWLAKPVEGLQTKRG